MGIMLHVVPKYVVEVYNSNLVNFRHQPEYQLYFQKLIEGKIIIIDADIQNIVFLIHYGCY